jgi:hypothetical protein
MHLRTHIYDFNAQSSFAEDLKKWTLKIKNSTIGRVKASGIKNYYSSCSNQESMFNPIVPRSILSIEPDGIYLLNVPPQWTPSPSFPSNIFVFLNKSKYNSHSYGSGSMISPSTPLYMGKGNVFWSKNTLAYPSKHFKFI